MSTTETPDFRETQVKRFAFRLGIAATFLAVLPALIAWLTKPPGSTYLGMQFNTDDHMVYAAWMRQAMDGHFFFNNRFTTDAQPGLTVNLYFWILGNLARLFGIVGTMTLARAAFTFLFAILSGRLMLRLNANVFVAKLALTLIVVGGGVGFMMWQDFGQIFVQPQSALSQLLTFGRIPTDVWQPEGYVFPSMLTNSLFMVSLCLIVGVLISVIDSRDSWRPAIAGAICFGILMNVHSYDVLLLGMVLVAFATVCLTERQATPAWALRVLLIGIGAIPAALWFMHVLKVDPVFQQRAATPTFSPNFRQLLFGYLPLLTLGIAPLFTQFKKANRPMFGLIGVTLGLLALSYFSARHNPDGYWMSLPVWCVVYICSIALSCLCRSENPGFNLVLCWAFVGTIAPYFPALFERKLMMGLSIPWAIMAAYGIHNLIHSMDRGARNLATALGIILLGATSIRWFARENTLRQENVSSTTVHPVYLSSDVSRIIDYLNKRTKERIVVLAMPGLPSPSEDPDAFLSPTIPDLNPILSGLTGVYTYAGHWSETPNYGERRAELMSGLYLPGATMEGRKQFLDSVGANYVIAPSPEAYSKLGLPDLSPLGETIIDGAQFKLIRISSR